MADMSNLDALVDEAMLLGDADARDLAIDIRNQEVEHQRVRRNRLWNLGDMIDSIKHPYLDFSDIVTVVEAAPDEDAQLQAVMARLAERGEWDPLLAELAIATVGPQDTDAIVYFLNSLAIDKKDHITTAGGKKLVECVACEEQLPPKDLTLTSCGHCYCGSCLSLVFNATISDESLYPPRCCAQTPIPIEHAKRFLDSGFEETFRDKGVELNTIDRTYCSNPTCSAFILPEDYVRDRATCHKCWQRTCIVCKAPGHEGDCPADLELAALLKYAEDMGWQRCYNCLSVVQRHNGCSHMECRCGANFCYNCGRRIFVEETTRCPCQNAVHSPYRFYRRDEHPVDPWNEVPADVPALAEPVPADFIWVGVPEENPELEQDRSQAGTPDFEWPLDQREDIDNGERASLASSRRSRTPDVDAVQNVTPPIANERLLPVTSDAAFVSALRQLLSTISTQLPVLLNQEHENQALNNTSSAMLQPELASGSAPEMAPEMALEMAPEMAPDDLNRTADEDSQHSRSRTSSEDNPASEKVSDVQLSDHSDSGVESAQFDNPVSKREAAQSSHNIEDASEHKSIENSSFTSKQSTRHSHLRTKLSLRRLLRVLRKAGISALRRKGHTSPYSDEATFE
ncbi:hypothetical protein KCU91_g12857, partial [Aureobasidium melanogenum]